MTAPTAEGGESMCCAVHLDMSADTAEQAGFQHIAKWWRKSKRKAHARVEVTVKASRILNSCSLADKSRRGL